MNQGQQGRLLVLLLASCAAGSGSGDGPPAVSAPAHQPEGDLPDVIFFVSALHGNDFANGRSPATAFRTLTRCAAAMEASTIAPATCEVGSGTYREAVTLAGGPRLLRFHASGSTRRPVLSGLDVLSKLRWQRHSHCVYVAQLPSATPEFQQLFFDGRMMVEARWPNLDVGELPAQVLDRHRWQRTGSGSQYLLQGIYMSYESHNFPCFVFVSVPF